jgi:hypothetical protein
MTVVRAGRALFQHDGAPSLARAADVLSRRPFDPKATMTQKQTKATKRRESGSLKPHTGSDQFTVTSGGAIVATGTRESVWSYAATHGGDFAVRIAA